MRELYLAIYTNLTSFINSINTFEEDAGVDYRTMSLLDYTGYDSLAVNNLEQLCVNFSNEKYFEKFFVENLIEKEKKVFEEEGLRKVLAEFPEFQSNSDLIKIIESKDKPIGLLKLISMVSQSKRTEQKPKEAYKGFVTDLTKTYKNSSHIGHKVKKKADEFHINHSFYTIEYDPSNFIEIDKNSSLEGFFLTIIKQNNSELHEFLGPYLAAVENYKYSSYGEQFVLEINNIYKEMSACEIKYVLNIRPNNKMKCEEFDQLCVIPQIQNLGLVDFLSFKKATYPIRKDCVQFTRKFLEIKKTENRFFDEISKDADPKYKKIAQE